MRYLIFKNNVSNEEINARMQYIYDIFHVYTFKDSQNSNSTMTVLVSIPKNEIDVLMIIGHAPWTNNYIMENIGNISESNIIVISCNTGIIRNLRNFYNKKVFLPKMKGKIDYYDGKEIGFEFDITDEENMLYKNRKMELYAMILTALEEVN